jgi:hypothetical protein
VGEALARLNFEGEVIHWRGPSPYFFVVVPVDDAGALREAARSVSYGWGMTPVEARVRSVPFRTALFLRDGTYYLPLKDAVRAKADISVGNTVAVEIVVRPRSA